MLLIDYNYNYLDKMNTAEIKLIIKKNENLQLVD